MPVDPVADGHLYKNGTVVSTTNTNRIQAGFADNTEYRIVLTFDLAALQGKNVHQAMLNLSEFQAISPGGLILEHIDPAAPIDGSAYGSTAKDSRVVLAGRSGSSDQHIRREFDVTEWLVQDLANGQSSISFRLRIDPDDPLPAISIRAFRPAEYTPGDSSDAPRLEVSAS
jgi:hypothetical protein